jgi:hypothetical protein
MSLLYLIFKGGAAAASIAPPVTLDSYISDNSNMLSKPPYINLLKTDVEMFLERKDDPSNEIIAKEVYNKYINNDSDLFSLHLEILDKDILGIYINYVIYVYNYLKNQDKKEFKILEYNILVNIVKDIMTPYEMDINIRFLLTEKKNRSILLQNEFVFVLKDIVLDNKPDVREKRLKYIVELGGDYIEEIIISNSFIKDIKYLHLLPNLLRLKCDNCLLLKYIYNLPKLKILDCSNCTELISIESVPMLKKLNCTECPKLILIKLRKESIKDCINCKEYGRLYYEFENDVEYKHPTIKKPAHTPNKFGPTRRPRTRYSPHSPYSPNK